MTSGQELSTQADLTFIGLPPLDRASPTFRTIENGDKPLTLHTESNVDPSIYQHPDAQTLWSCHRDKHVMVELHIFHGRVEKLHVRKHSKHKSSKRNVKLAIGETNGKL